MNKKNSKTIEATDPKVGDQKAREQHYYTDPSTRRCTENRNPLTSHHHTASRYFKGYFDPPKSFILGPQERGNYAL